MQKTTRIELVRVHFIPKALEPGKLYVSEEFDAVVHLCACGCGAKVSTPLGPTEWSLVETAVGPTLDKSVGSWQLPCRSHYWIRGGNVIWSGDWSDEQVIAGRRAEEERRREYYDTNQGGQESIFAKFWRWLASLFK